MNNRLVSQKKTMNGEVIVQNLIPHLQAWWPVIKIIGYMCGFLLSITGIIRAAGRDSGGTSKWKVAAFQISGGVLLLNVVSVLDVFSQSFFGKASETGLSYAAPGGNDPLSIYITFAIYIVMLVGFCGIVTAGMMLARADSNGYQAGRIMTHLIGGTFAVNIVTFLHALGSSMGPSVESAVNRIIG